MTYKTQAGDAVSPIVIGADKYEFGLTKREYFASMAMQGVLTTNDYRPDETAVIAVKVADALIEALNKETK